MKALLDVFVFLLYVFGFVVAMMPIFIYRELIRQGRQRSADAARLLGHLRRIDEALTPQVVEEDPPAEYREDSGSILPSGRRIVIRR